MCMHVQVHAWVFKRCVFTCLWVNKVYYIFVCLCTKAYIYIYKKLGNSFKSTLRVCYAILAKNQILSLDFSIWPPVFMCLPLAWELKRPSASLGGRGPDLQHRSVMRLRYKKVLNLGSSTEKRGLGAIWYRASSNQPEGSTYPQANRMQQVLEITPYILRKRREKEQEGGGRGVDSQRHLNKHKPDAELEEHVCEHETGVCG